MNREERLALLKQDFERLLSMRAPTSVQAWQPSESQRAIYGGLLESILNGIDIIKSIEKSQLLREGHVQNYVPDTILAFYREEIEPRFDVLKRAYKAVDPDGAEFYELTEGIGAPRGAGGLVRDTFTVGIEQVHQLIERAPDLGYEERFLPEKAIELMGSKLIGFDPDSWLDRAGELITVRTNRKNVTLPVHVHLRLKEIFRSYIFGCWLSVLALSRAVLEYAILDNLHKFSIDQYHPIKDKRGNRREKRLEELISEIGVFVPAISQSMEKLRGYGNDYLHPKTSRVSKEMLFQSEANAKDALKTLIEVVEALYLAKKSGG